MASIETVGTSTPIEVLVNGAAETTPPCTLAELVTRRGLNTRSLVVVLNEQSIKRELWPSVRLSAGDQLELLNLVAGG